MFRADRARLALATNGLTLDVDKLRRLMMQVSSKVPGLPAQARLALLPYMMPGSRMPRIINIELYIYPPKDTLIMTGLTSVYLKGLPSCTVYTTPKEEIKMVTLCIPTRLATNS